MLAPYMQYPFETLQGIIVGVICSLGALLVTKLPKYHWVYASMLCVIITPLVLLPFWLSYGDLGISDWDYYFSMHTNVLNTITQHHQFPLWNPYTCGGTSALGDPEFPVLSPLFLHELLFGVPAGLKLSIYTFTAVIALGMLHLSRKIGIGVLGGLTAALAVAFGTVNLLEIVEGHQNILAAMYIPWVLFFWYSAYIYKGKKKNIALLAIAILLTFMFFQGGIYLLMYMSGVFAFLPLLVTRPKRAILITFSAGVLALGLSSIKLIPVALWVQQFQDTAYASSAFTLANLDDIFLGRILYGAENIIPNQGGGWHEYGAYIGPVILVLALIGYISHSKNIIVRALLVSAVFATFVSSLGPYLQPLFDTLPFIPRSNISRVILLAVLPISLLAGFGIDYIQKKSRAAQVLALILFSLAAVDIISLVYPLASQAFVLPHVAKTIEKAPYPIAYSPFEYKTRHKGVDYTRAYDATLSGYGNMTYCSVLGPNPSVSVITDEYNTNILQFSDDKDATFTLEHWSPNRVVAKTHTTKETYINLNANYAKGWYANDVPAAEKGNRPSYLLQAGDATVEFSYSPPGLYAGVAVSSITLIFVLYLVSRILRL